MEEGQYSLEVFNSLGQRVYGVELADRAGDIKMDLGAEAPGIYLVLPSGFRMVTVD